ncbi:MAG: ectoine/hydroxyectoine ABC transporter substrate-binding protein EhuB [Gammaproteobacteria bacterium]|nr:ectoine/hydroxyectoine ABC transporter substrate-binding protein EhuB [Gammaproteobacteria bacterium]
MNVRAIKLAFGLLTALASLCSISSAYAETTLERAKANGFVRIAFANESPYGFATPDGKLTGEAPEIARAVLASMGIPEVDGVLTEWGSLIPGLKAGRFDMIAAGMFITAKRCKQISFSEPTYGMGQALMVKQGNPKNLRTYEDVAKAGATLAVVAGAIEVDQAKDKGVTNLLTIPDFATGLAAVQSGRADAFALTSISILQLVERAGPDAGVERAEPFTFVNSEGKVQKGHGGFGFRKEDEDLLAEFNKHLTEFVGSEEHLTLVGPFGFGKSELPEMTAAQLCVEG